MGRRKAEWTCSVIRMLMSKRIAAGIVILSMLSRGSLLPPRIDLLDHTVNWEERTM